MCKYYYFSLLGYREKYCKNKPLLIGNFIPF